MARILTVAILPIFFLQGLVLNAQQKYTGPPPPKKDLPYLVHADNLVPTETVTATGTTKKNDTTYVVAGEKSSARTPLASPTLVVDADHLAAETLRLFRMEIKNGHREVTIRSGGKGGTMPLNTNIIKLSGNLYQIEVVDSLTRGQYSLSPDGTNDAFCFEVF